MRRSLKKLISTALAFTLALATSIGVAGTTADAYDVMKGAKKQVDKTVNLSEPEYHAYIAIQCVPAYSFRNAWFSSYGDYDKVNRAEDGSSLFNNILGWKDNGLVTLPGTITDAVIDGNGTYTVKIEGLEGCLTDGSLTDPNDSFQMLYISTDIPADAQDKIQITNIRTSIDGVEKSVVDEAFYDPDPIEYVNCLAIDVINLYNNDLVSESLMLPEDSVSITFDVSGFEKDSEQVAETSSSTSASSSTETTTSGSNTNATTTSADNADTSSPVNPAVFIVIGVVVVVVVVVVIIVSKKKE